MTTLSTVIFAASTVRAVGIVIALVAIVGFIVYGLFNIRAGREEVGSELELAANLKPYMDDEELETRKLDRVLTFALAGLVITGVGLPAYWLTEPGRHSGGEIEYERIFAARGEQKFESACAGCHGSGAVGAVASYTILSPENEFVAQVQWKAPALDTVMLRYSREEVTYVLNYGRAFSPMPAWGLPGGGAFTDQEVKNLVDYLASITISSEDSKAAVEGQLKTALGVTTVDYNDPKTGQALFNLGRETGFAGGSYACGRCHTKGWSIDQNPLNVKPASADLDVYVNYADGAGGYGPRINQDLIPRQFSSVDVLADFLYVGAKLGEAYGNNGISGDGMMPGFGENPNTEEIADDGMLTMEMVRAIAIYVESLHEENAGR